MTDPVKEKIRLHFNKAAGTYDAYCTVQNLVCVQSLECLHKFRSDFNNIADFACGTGESTLHLIQQFTFNQCYALDFAENLLAVARGKLLEQVNIQIIEADFERPLSISSDLDLIFCNMGLQWSYDIAKTIRLWHSYLDDKGLLLFSMPTSNNFKELAPIYKPEFMEHQQIIDLISNQRSELLCADIIKITQQFDHPISALKSLKATGTNYSKGIYEQGSLSPVRFDQIFSDPNDIRLTYQIGIYLVRKI